MKGWMIRAGSSGILFDDFVRENAVAIGWSKLGDIRAYKNKDALTKAYKDNFDEKPGKRAGAVAMLDKFLNVIQKGDLLVSYNAELRKYLVAEDLGEFRYEEGLIGNYPQLRSFNLKGYINRDDLKQKTKNSLGSTLTLFTLNDETIHDLLAVLEGKTNAPTVIEDTDIEDDTAQLKDNTVDQSLELIKDKINKLSPDDMEELVATVLRAMGFKAKVSPKGADRNVDVFASPDGLGLTSPRIKAEVKHRNGSMGSKEIRSFIGALRDGDRGLYISTGGFTKDARYEAERANVPVQLINIDDLAHLVVDNYESFDIEGRTLIPLVKIYWPAV